jgi:hypothetical protein
MMSNFAKRLNVFISVLIILGTAGCATTDYTTHYGIFTAENSAGELRQFRIHWQTLRYEGWAENTFRALPVVLETQCSKRKLYFYDSAYGQSRRCLGGDKEGIYYCADSNVDMDRHGLDGDVLITLSCRPKQSFKKVKGKKKSIDFLLNSELPYIVTTKQVKGRDLDLVIPSLSRHSSICDPDS